MNTVDKQTILHLLIEGHVQGVGFRYSTQQQASLLNLRGWVKNRNDGRVELVALGEPKNINSFHTWCQSGPKFALVTRCRQLTPPDHVDLAAFEIER